MLDPDGALAAANRAHERRWFACDETYGGVFVLRGELDAEGGMLVKTAIDALMPVPAPGDERSASQRRADALVDLGGDVVARSVGRSRRTIPPHIREALRLRDNGCRFPGCDRPHEWCDAHHWVHWADGGKTELSNLLSLCRRHHRVVHEEGWSISLDDGAVVITPPPQRR